MKNNYSQYKQIIKAAFVKNTYDHIQLLSADIITYVAPNKFALKALNCLVYDREISHSLVPSYLLGLHDYYILSDNLKSINPTIFWKCFSKFALNIFKPRLVVNDFVRLRH